MTVAEPVTTKNLDEDWDEQTSGLPGATFFDSSAWLEAFAYKADRVRKLGFFQGHRLVSALSLGIEENHMLLHAQIPFSASFGGLIMAANPSLVSIDGAVRALLDTLRQEAHGRPLQISYVQRPRHVSGHPQYELEEFALLKNGFSVQDIQLEYYVDLSQMHFSQTLRNELRKKHEIEFHPATMAEFLAFRERVAEQQGKTKTLPNEELMRTSELFGDKVRVFKATHSERTAAMLLSDELTSECAIGRNWFQDAEFGHLGATAFIVSKWINDLKCRGFAHAGFGASARLSKDLIPGFLFFKERFHPRTAMRKTYVLRHVLDRTQEKD